MGNWVSNQCARKDELSDEKKALLNKFGFVRNVFEADWLDHYDELKAYMFTNGNANVPQANKKLGSWVNRQRNKKKKGKLYKERKLGCIW